MSWAPEPHPSPIKISVDTSALDAAKGKVQSDIAGLGGHPTPIRLPAPDTSAIDNAKSKVQSDIAGLGGHPSPVRLPAPDLSALVAAKGAAAADGAAVGAGFAAGIAGEAGAAAAAGASLAAAAEAAMKVSMKISSPSKVTEEIGKQTGEGYAKGITDTKSAVSAASASIGSASVASLIQGLEGGQSNQQAVQTAIYGALANPDAVTTVQQTIQTLLQDIPAGKDLGLVKWLNQQQSKETALANKQGALMAQINNAQQLATSAISGASVTSAYGYTPALAASNGPQASQSIVTGMQQQLADTQNFSSQLAALKKMGLNATSLSQLAQAGTTAGLPLAEGLAQGGKGAVAQMNAIESQIIKASQKIGSVGGTAMYQAGQAVTAGLDQPLKDELKTVDADMSKIANAIIKTVQQKLGTKAAASSSSASGSTAAATTAAATTAVSGAASAGLGPAATGAATGLGKVGPAGGAAATGLDSVASAAGAAASGLGKISAALAPLLAAVQPSSGRAQPLGGGGFSAQTSGGGGNVTHVHNYNIQGSLIHQNDLADQVQTAVLASGFVVWNAGIYTYPGLHASSPRPQLGGPVAVRGVLSGLSAHPGDRQPRPVPLPALGLLGVRGERVDRRVARVRPAGCHVGDGILQQHRPVQQPDVQRRVGVDSGVHRHLGRADLGELFRHVPQCRRGGGLRLLRPVLDLDAAGSRHQQQRN